jgi:hypothetical protein
MVTVAFKSAEAVTNAIMSLPPTDQRRCVARQVEQGFEIDAPNELAEALKGEHPPAPLPSTAGITYKADIYRRCTDAEADAIEMALIAAPVRQRRLFESALHLDHSDEAFAFAQEALVGMFGKKRAAELLAAS